LSSPEEKTITPIEAKKKITKNKKSTDIASPAKVASTNSIVTHSMKRAVTLFQAKKNKREKKEKISDKITIKMNFFFFLLYWAENVVKADNGTHRPFASESCVALARIARVVHHFTIFHCSHRPASIVVNGIYHTKSDQKVRHFIEIHSSMASLSIDLQQHQSSTARK
jgi:hypothetical protein